MHLKNLIGQKFGMLTVISKAESKIDSSGKSRTRWNCRCDCGRNVTVLGDYLKRSSCPSCGCQASKNRREKNRVDYTGQKFGRLTIIDILWNTKPIKAVCLCDCGNKYIGTKADIVSGHTKSCGCLQSENTSIANTKDWTGYIAESGVEFIKPHHLNKYGQWVWECRCGVCGNIFYELPARINNGHTTSCGCVIRSFNEIYIQSLLEDAKISFMSQYIFNDCKYVYVLRFDFAIFQNDKLIGLIEYDGKQHFEPVEWFGGEDGFMKTKLRDEIKNKYCKSHNIPLLRLPYTLSSKEIKIKLYEYYESLTTAGCV